MRFAAAAVLAITAVALPTALGSLPPALDKYLTTYVKLTPVQRRQLLAGAPVTALLEANAGQEVGVFGAVWIDASASSYVAQMKDIERFESGGAFRVTKRTTARRSSFECCCQIKREGGDSGS